MDALNLGSSLQDRFVMMVGLLSLSGTRNDSVVFTGEIV